MNRSMLIKVNRTASRFVAGLAVALLACAVVVPAWAQQQAAPLSVVFEPKDVAVLSAEVPGRVTLISKKLGEPVQQGDVLVELDPAMYKANLQKAQAAASATGSALDMTKKLRGYKSASKLDEINAQKEANTAYANVALAKEELKATKISAPFSGFVQRVVAREHQFVDKGEPVIEVVNDSVIRVRILMPASAYKSMQIGQDFTVAVTETGDTVSGRVTQISHVLDPGSSTFDVYGEVDNAAGVVRSGMTGTLITQ